MLNTEVNMRYTQKRNYRDSKIVTEEIIVKRVKKKKIKKEGFFKKVINWFKKNGGGERVLPPL